MNKYKSRIDPVGGSKFSKIKRFRKNAPSALLWYTFRFFRQKFNLFYLKIVGFGFRRIGHNVIIDGIPKFLFPCSNIQLMDNVRIGSKCVFQGSNNSEVIIGNNVSINDGCFITSMIRIEIGEFTSVGEYTSIRDYNHHFEDDTNIKQQGYFGSPINIGRDCWIGRGCIILPGVTIGDETIVAANSVVNKDLPPRSIFGGVPVKFLKNRYSKND